ncbi:hypothetical protein [Thermoflavimicrobium dichotomicum]|uniref:MnmG N-terminal domain-containing protein n=1 Tax=Thermoflavimicrobium dichotomicum TaxID=46223 RepID=A0A1I3UPU8_9BACL|nr:hypothetical protein [Thermoflavimicrobium dichotomicum]SFJ84749.1 hypothetical protein SAMN05421852_12634 [Thermoflavimicrobium dichotomicum]
MAQSGIWGSLRFESEIAGLYLGGDGAGITRVLAQAGACGVWIARDIVKKLRNHSSSQV